MQDVEHDIPEGLPVVMVDNTLRALSSLAAAFYDQCAALLASTHNPSWSPFCRPRGHTAARHQSSVISHQSARGPLDVRLLRARDPSHRHSVEGALVLGAPLVRMGAPGAPPLRRWLPITVTRRTGRRGALCARELKPKVLRGLGGAVWSWPQSVCGGSSVM